MFGKSIRRTLCVPVAIALLTLNWGATLASPANSEKRAAANMSAAGAQTKSDNQTSPFPSPRPGCGLGWQVQGGSGEANTVLRDVSAISATDAWAVGNTNEPGDLTHSVAEHWNGTSWTRATTPNPGPSPDNDGFSTVAAIASNDVWALGSDGGSFDKTSSGLATGVDLIVAHWDGTSWTAMPHPTFQYGAMLLGVAAVASNDIWAVGYYDNDGDPNTGYVSLILHWNGTAWSQMTVPSLANESPGGLNYLASVTVAGPNDVYAAGAYDAQTQSAGGRIPLMLHWNGAAWSQETVPGDNFEDGAAELYGVSAGAPNNVWAVGYLDGDTYLMTLHWNGTAWTYYPGSVPSGAVAPYLYSVSAIGSTEAWAVGTYHLDGQPQVTVVDHWDGQSWHTVSSPNVGTGDNILYGVKALGSGDMFAVGEANGGSSLYQYRVGPPVFTDTDPAGTFYAYISWMACRGYITGYACGSPGEPCISPYDLAYFRPNNHVTRGQLTKMVVNATQWTPVTPTTNTFADVPVGSTFFTYIETAYSHAIIGGYTCGGVGEPCDSQHRPYFRPNTNLTRGQLSKIIALAKNYTLPDPPTPTFSDVPRGSTFYGYVEAMHTNGIVGGYSDGTFRPNNPATRGEVTKFVTLAYGGPDPNP